MTREDDGRTKLGNDGKKIDELDELGVPALDGGATDVAGATVVPDGAPDSTGAAVSPGTEPAGIDSPTTETDELEVGSSESLPPMVLMTIKTTPMRSTMTETGVSAFFHMVADSTTARKGQNPPLGTSSTRYGLDDTTTESAHFTTWIRRESISKTAT